MANGNGKPGGAVWISLLWSFVLPAISGAVGATVWVFSMRDQTLAAISKARDEEILRRQEALSHYVSVEQFLEYRRTQQERSDKEYYQLIAAMNRLEARIK